MLQVWGTDLGETNNDFSGTDVYMRVSKIDDTAYFYASPDGVKYTLYKTLTLSSEFYEGAVLQFYATRNYGSTNYDVWMESIAIANLGDITAEPAVMQELDTLRGTIGAYILLPNAEYADDNAKIEAATEILNGIDSSVTYALVKNEGNNSYQLTITKDGTSQVIPGMQLVVETATWETLSELIAQVQGLDESAYTFATWNKLESALQKAQSCTEATDALQIIEAYDRLTFAMDSLEKISYATVSFDANGGSGEMAAVTVEEGKDYTLPECTFTAPEGKQFKAWSVNGEEKAVGTAITVSGDVTITAVWEDIPVVTPETYTVTFNTNGGSTVESVAVEDGKTVAKPADPTKDGYTFDGWYVDEALTTAYDFNTAVTDNITLYAKWTEASSGVVITTNYRITVTQTAGGKISPATVSISKGSSRTFTITAEEGYEIADVLVDGKSVGAVSSYTFENVTAKHTLTAKFEKIEETEETVDTVAGFIDVKTNDWFADAVQYVVDEGLMNGTSETTFTPNGDTTRGMIVTILYRQAGSPDVESDGATWWSDARVWAMENGISDGTNMDKAITREQLATMLYRYAELTGEDVSKTASLEDFQDADKVSSYAVEALEWAAGNGIVTGKTGSVIDPQAGATRAETATMLMRFCELGK